MGEDLDPAKLEDLAKTDQLPLIYQDRILEKPSRPTTRSLSKQAKLLENAYVEQEEEEADDQNAHDSVTDSLMLPDPSAPKKVRFNLP